MTTQLPFTRYDVTFASGDSTCAAWLYLPDDPRLRIRADCAHPSPRPPHYHSGLDVVLRDRSTP